MPYLVCEKCGRYYELKEGESPTDFEDKCPCGGTLQYEESLAINNFQSSDLSDSAESNSFDGVESNLSDNDKSDLFNFNDSNLSEDNVGDLSYKDRLDVVDDSNSDLSDDDEPPSKNKLSKNLFLISGLLIFIVIIISAGILNHQSGSSGVFASNENEKYSSDEINTFLESTFNPDDYGNHYDKLGKWNINVVRIKVFGSPTPEDMETLNKAINDINTNVKDFQLKIDDKNQMEPDIEIYFIPHSQFTQYSHNPSEVDGFTMWMVSTSGIYGGNSVGEIYKARVIVGTDQKSQERRSHVIIHELEHALGLHHNINQNSVLCVDGPDYTQYTDIDKTMIRMLYRNDMLPNMSRNQVETILNNSRSGFF